MNYSWDFKFFKRIEEGEPYTNAIIGYKHSKRVIDGEVYWDIWRIGINLGIILIKITKEKGMFPSIQVKPFFRYKV